MYCTIDSKFYTFRVIDLGKVKDYVAKMRELSSTEPFASVLKYAPRARVQHFTW